MDECTTCKRQWIACPSTVGGECAACLCEQRDELLAACKAALPLIQKLNTAHPAYYVCEYWSSKFAYIRTSDDAGAVPRACVMADLKAAIAKARGATNEETPTT